MSEVPRYRRAIGRYGGFVRWRCPWYRGTSLIRKRPPNRTTIGHWALGYCREGGSRVAAAALFFSLSLAPLALPRSLSHTLSLSLSLATPHLTHLSRTSTAHPPLSPSLPLYTVSLSLSISISLALSRALSRLHPTRTRKHQQVHERLGGASSLRESPRLRSSCTNAFVAS